VPALQGDTLLIGDLCRPAGGKNEVGVLVPFRRDGDRWRYVDPPIPAPETTEAVHFGWGTVIDGDTAIVSATGRSPGSSQTGVQGAVYVYARSGAAWSYAQKLSAPGGRVGDTFGSAVAISGDAMAIIAPGIEPHSVYLYARAAGAWSLAQTITPPGADARGTTSIALSGERLVIGMHPYAVEPPGAAYVYGRAGTTWALEATLAQPDPTAPEAFGSTCVGMVGDVVFVCAYTANAGRGTIRKYRKGGATYAPDGELTPASLVGTRSFFGSALWISGNRLLVDAPEALLGLGAVFVFAPDGASWKEEAMLTHGGSFETRFGQSAAFTGDRAVILASDGMTAFHRTLPIVAPPGSGGTGGGDTNGGGASGSSASGNGGRGGTAAGGCASSACAPASGAGTACDGAPCQDDGAKEKDASGCGCVVVAADASGAGALGGVALATATLTVRRRRGSERRRA
jgi:hypothetical protein